MASRSVSVASRGSLPVARDSDGSTTSPPAGQALRAPRGAWERGMGAGGGGGGGGVPAGARRGSPGAGLVSVGRARAKRTLRTLDFLRR